MSIQGFWRPGARPVIREESSIATEDTPAAPFNFRSAPIAQQRLLLPIHRHRRQILYAMENYHVLVVVGETGCGKSTQLPQYLYENGWADQGLQVVCTQPRRLAAQTLARRVSNEIGSELGRKVGYTVRFDDSSGPETQIKYVTDGVLLREATMSDPLLLKYSVIMVDEAHERSLNTDVLLGVLKKIRRKRKGLRVIVCSATIDAEAFLDFFIPQSKGEHGEVEPGRKRRRWGRVGDDPSTKVTTNLPTTDKGTIVSVDGRQHPVDVMFLAEPTSNYIRCAVETALRIHEEACGADQDILCFLPSGEDIDRAIKLAEDQASETATSKVFHDVTFLPLYGTLPYQMQARVFQPKQSSERHIRRVIFATNIAETSVTVPDISHVIDCGFVKLPYFDPKTSFDRLIISPVSLASARQRAGRAGRVQSGKCYRLYTEKWLSDDMMARTEPEVLRTNLSGFILTLKALGVSNILAFDLMDLPSVDALSHALECLYALGAIDEQTALTPRGVNMSSFPTEPRVSRMLLESIDRGCAWEVLSVASALQVRALFFQPRTQTQRVEYDSAMSQIVDRSGDHVTYANLLAEYDDTQLSEEDCKARFINFLALKRAMEVRTQLSRIVRRHGRLRALGLTGDDRERSSSIRMCVSAGFFFNVAKLANDGQYYTLRGKHMVTLSQSSILSSHGDTSEYIIFGETSDGPRGGIEVRSCSAIQARWLRELAPNYWD